MKAWEALVKLNMIQTYHWFHELCPLPYVYLLNQAIFWQMDAASGGNNGNEESKGNDGGFKPKEDLLNILMSTLGFSRNAATRVCKYTYICLYTETTIDRDVT